jgi:hypothetical protein
VLSQRYAAGAHPRPEQPYGYQLGRRTRMTLDVYNFNRHRQTVRLVGRAWEGWSFARARARVVVPAMGRVRVPFTLTAAASVRRGVDYPLAFDATVGGRAVPPSVSRVQLRGDHAGDPLLLAPMISSVSPARDASVPGRPVRIRANVVDLVSGIDPARVTVEVDGERVRSRFDAARGEVTAAAPLEPGQHELWVRAVNRAHAPAGVAIPFTVER